MKTATSLTLLASLALAQDVTVPSTCTDGFESGRDVVIYTIPYTYDQTLSIIGSYKNLTWSGNPADTVTLNGTDNTVGTARTYDLAGSHVIETILSYSKPSAPGPYQEVHNTALLTVPSANVSLYIPYDGTVVSSVCGGRASRFNFTAEYCATDAALAGQILHMLHMGDAVTVGQFLGGNNFTTCAALGANGTMPVPSGTGTGSYPPAFTGSADRSEMNLAGVLLTAFVGSALAFLA